MTIGYKHNYVLAPITLPSSLDVTMYYDACDIANIPIPVTILACMIAKVVHCKLGPDKLCSE